MSQTRKKSPILFFLKFRCLKPIIGIQFWGKKCKNFILKPLVAQKVRNVLFGDITKS